MQDTTYQVIIVGAGPAGLAASLTLSAYKISHCIVDANTSAVQKPGDAVPPNAKPLLKQLGILGLLENPLHIPYYSNKSCWGTNELLEKELIDFSCTLDANKKLPKQQLRDFFKQAFSSFLAPQTLTKAKHGFGLPFGSWMQQSDELMALVAQSLQRLSERNIINPEFIDRAISMHKQEHAGYYGELIWILVVLELWLEAHQR